MVYESDEISNLYNGSYRPTILLKEIVKRELGLSHGDINTIKNAVAAKEKTCLLDIATGKGNTELLNRTTKNAYDFGRIAFSGKSLQEEVLNITSNGTKLKALDTVKIINNRFLIS